jgi:hypothetical protein
VSLDFSAQAGAVCSPCGDFRLALWRCWDSSLPLLGFGCLNPSTAGPELEDSTSRKFRGFAERLGFGGYATWNLYAFRATDPKDLKAAGYPVGDENDEYIEAISRAVAMTICGWGSNAARLTRPANVLSLLRRLGVRPYALRINSDGTPAHPLYLPYTLKPQPMAPATREHGA